MSKKFTVKDCSPVVWINTNTNPSPPILGNFETENNLSFNVIELGIKWGERGFTEADLEKVDKSHELYNIISDKRNRLAFINGLHVGIRKKKASEIAYHEGEKFFFANKSIEEANDIYKKNKDFNRGYYETFGENWCLENYDLSELDDKLKDNKFIMVGYWRCLGRRWFTEGKSLNDKEIDKFAPTDRILKQYFEASFVKGYMTANKIKEKGLNK